MAIRRTLAQFSDEIVAADIADGSITAAKVTAWATYRTSLRDLPDDQSSETTYADITWPTEPE